MPSVHITVGPAYGRDYITAKAALDDWQAGKDFRILTAGPDEGRYISNRDGGGLKIAIRFNHLREIIRVP